MEKREAKELLGMKKLDEDSVLSLYLVIGVLFVLFYVTFVVRYL
jgi:hypothetical protein